VQQSLDYTTSHDTGIQYLREKHREYLPDTILRTSGAPRSSGKSRGTPADLA
jgi:hypothetical protein